MNFSEQVKTARLQLGITQMKLAAELCVSFSSINRWERGHTEPPQLFKKAFYEFCKQNGIDIEMLNVKCGGNK